jgi:hypothetical protein
VYEVSNVWCILKRNYKKYIYFNTHNLASVLRSIIGGNDLKLHTTTTAQLCTVHLYIILYCMLSDIVYIYIVPIVGNNYCSASWWRPQKVDKRMVLEYTHGLFIT